MIGPYISFLWVVYRSIEECQKATDDCWGFDRVFVCVCVPHEFHQHEGVKNLKLLNPWTIVDDPMREEGWESRAPIPHHILYCCQEIHSWGSGPKLSLSLSFPLWCGYFYNYCASTTTSTYGIYNHTNLPYFFNRNRESARERRPDAAVKPNEPDLARTRDK